MRLPVLEVLLIAVMFFSVQVGTTAAVFLDNVTSGRYRGSSVRDILTMTVQPPLPANLSKISFADSGSERPYTDKDR